MAHVRINAEGCKACMLCIAFCPHECIVVSETLNTRGFHPAEFTEGSDCRGCRMCALMCPDVCIEVYQDKKPVGSKS